MPATPCPKTQTMKQAACSCTALPHRPPGTVDEGRKGQSGLLLGPWRLSGASPCLGFSSLGIAASVQGVGGDGGTGGLAITSGVELGDAPHSLCGGAWALSRRTRTGKPALAWSPPTILVHSSDSHPDLQRHHLFPPPQVNERDPTKKRAPPWSRVILAPVALGGLQPLARERKAGA